MTEKEILRGSWPHDTNRSGIRPFVIPAEAGIQSVEDWIPASAEMTSYMTLNDDTSAAAHSVFMVFKRS
jgi:hypothetical protein